MFTYCKVTKKYDMAYTLFVFFLAKRLVEKQKDLHKSGGSACKSCALSDRGDSNSRPPRPERGTLPTALLSECKIFFATAKVRISERKRKFICSFPSEIIFIYRSNIYFGDRRASCLGWWE